MTQALDKLESQVAPRLLADHAEATAWVEQAKATFAHCCVFGRLVGGVVWSDVRGAGGALIVPIDPTELAAEITAKGFDLLRGHDPGRPQGKVLTASAFTSADGSRFVAAVLGFYQGGASTSFRNLGVDPTPYVPSPAQLQSLPEACWIEFITDPREVETAWIDDVVATAPLPIRREEVSHNAVNPDHELIRVGVLFATLVWNPFVTAIATEAGKDAYAALRQWMRQLLTKVTDLRNPIVEIQSHHGLCYISFIIRGKDLKLHYKAHDALPVAAAQSAHLVANLKKARAAPKKIVYEFHSMDEIWYPSFAELHDGRFITDNKLLIGLEKLPTGLSLGIGLGNGNSQPPRGSSLA